MNKNNYYKLKKNFKIYYHKLHTKLIKQISDIIKDSLNSLGIIAKENITIYNIAQIFAKIPQYLISFLVYLIALFLFMLELPLLRSKAYHFFTEETAEKVSFMNERL